MTGAGVFAGAKIPTHEFSTKFGNPASINVPTFGSEGARAALVTPMPLMRPFWICGNAPATAVKTSGIEPPCKSIMA